MSPTAKATVAVLHAFLWFASIRLRRQRLLLPSSMRSSGSPPFVSDFGKLPPYDRSPPSRQDGKSFTAVCRPPCVSWFASISIEAVRQVVAVKVDALWSSPPRSPRWSSPPWFPRWSSVRLDCAPPWSYRLRGLPMAVLFVEGCRRGCATSASASAVSSRLLLSGREQVRDNELSWVSASQPGSRWTHRIF